MTRPRPQRPQEAARRRAQAAARQAVLVQTVARALAGLSQLAADPSQAVSQLADRGALAAAQLWTTGGGGLQLTAAHPAAADGCPQRHAAALRAAAEEAVTFATPRLVRCPCPDGDHEVFTTPVPATGGRAPAVGALVLAGAAGASLADADMLLAVLAAARFSAPLALALSDDALARQADLRGRLLTEVIAAAENERKRIAADIHDDTLQTMGMQLMKVQIIERLFERGDAAGMRRELEALAGSIQENADRLRAIMSELRPSMLRDYGLLAAIDDLIERFRAQTGVPVTFVSRLGRRLPDDHETMVYRIVQEGLTNIRKHAHATRASIELAGIGGWYTVTIEDDGQGFDPQEALERSLRTGHFGLITMRERAELIGGVFAIESAPGAGTRLHFQLPRLS